jgi:hypothetical protein
MDISNKYSTDSEIQLMGKAKAPNYHACTATELTTAVSDMETAYTDAAGRSNPDDAKINFETGKIGGKTLTPDVYTFTVDVQITGDIYLDAGGDADAVFIIQTTGNIIQAANTNVILSGSAKAENIFWQVAGTVTVGAGAHLEGILLVKTAVTFITGSSLKGRIFSQTAVTLQMATIAPYTQVTQVRRGLRGLQVA